MSANEFTEIADLFAPLTKGAPEALGLLDDAAVIAARPGFDLVITKDAIVEGVHALKGTSPSDLARKLLRVNLSDLAAKGASPDAVFLAVAWPADWSRFDRADFASGLGEDLKRYEVRLLGGDTVCTPGPFSASLTALGYCPAGAMVKRSGAQAGDRVLVTGTIGDGYLGLMAARGDAGFSPQDRSVLAQAYRLPRPRLALTPALRAFATAAADVSDGLLADLGNVARASGVRIAIDLDLTPLSPQASHWLRSAPSRRDALAALAAGGDDYEIVVTATLENATRLMQAGAALGLQVSDIGQVRHGEGLEVRFDGVALDVVRTGWSHI